MKNGTLENPNLHMIVGTMSRVAFLATGALATFTILAVLAFQLPNVLLTLLPSVAICLVAVLYGVIIKVR